MFSVRGGDDLFASRQKNWCGKQHCNYWLKSSIIPIT